LGNAANIARWGNPEPEAAFIKAHLTTVDFLGRRVTVHKQAAAAFRAVDADIKAAGITYRFKRVETYCHRYVRGYEAEELWSLHAFGVAVDINPDENPMRDDGVLQTDLPPEVVAIFKRHGFRWLGESSGRRKDAMHFELKEPTEEEQMDQATFDRMADNWAARNTVTTLNAGDVREATAGLAAAGLLEARHKGRFMSLDMLRVLVWRVYKARKP
jgi:hypothetical protein